MNQRGLWSKDGLDDNDFFYCSSQPYILLSSYSIHSFIDEDSFTLNLAVLSFPLMLLKGSNELLYIPKGPNKLPFF